MEFHTYVSSEQATEMDIIITELLKKLEQSNLPFGRKSELADALQKSGGCHNGSRYGLQHGITFADTELVCAYEYKGNPVDYLNYRYEFKYYPSAHVCKDYPLVVAVEASSRCNLRCRMCFQHHMDQAEPIQNQMIMPWEVYDTFLSELDAHRLFSIVFASRGEPLLNPDIDRMILEAKKKGVIDIKLNTNAVFLTEQLSRKLLLSGLDLIVFSVDSVLDDTYRTIRGADLKKVLANIDTFLRIKATEFPESQLKVRVAMVIAHDGINGTAEEIERAKDFWHNRVDELSIKTENDFTGIYRGSTALPVHQPCSLLWERVYLWADGTVNPCDIDHLSTLALGNIMKGDSIADIWNGAALLRLRAEHLTSRDKICSVCLNCVGY